jgi:riboflavin synthase
MFTGLIEAVCTVKSATGSSAAGAMQLSVDMGQLAEDVHIGDSIAINGTCLTVTKITNSIADFDVSGETLSKTTLGLLKPSSRANVERAMKPSDRFGGHFVQGHIDGTAKIISIEEKGRFRNVKFATENELLEQMVPKGSVAVDGISLTVSAMDKEGFTVALIPETLEMTTLDRAKIGDTVNIENDLIVKTIKKQLENILPNENKMTIEKLKQLGF